MLMRHSGGYDVEIDPDKVEAIEPRGQYNHLSWVITDYKNRLGFELMGKPSDVMKKLYALSKQS